MNPDIKANWITSLTNGEYHQGTGELRTVKDEYCCLGVLCDLAVKAGIAEWEYTTASGWLVIPKGSNSEQASMLDVGGAIIPRFIREWADLDDANPTVYRDQNDEVMALSQANDSLELPFTEIARMIRESEL